VERHEEGQDEHAMGTDNRRLQATGMKHARYKLRFFFDYGAGVCLWSANDAARAEFDYPIDHSKLSLSPATIATIDKLLAWHDTPLNWDYPPDPGPWRQEECDRFNAAVAALYASIVAELGEAFEVVDEHWEVMEDPDLDEYLRHPRGFRRR
jgi:hypothetical protein